MKILTMLEAFYLSKLLRGETITVPSSSVETTRPVASKVVHGVAGERIKRGDLVYFDAGGTWRKGVAE